MPTWQYAFLFFTMFYDIFGHAQKSKFWVFKQESDLRLGFGFRLFTSPSSPFLIFLHQWLTFYWACFQFKNFGESIIETGNLAKCHCRKFCSAFFTQISEHFHVHPRLYWAYHSDLGMIGKIFPQQNLSIDDTNFDQRWWHQRWKKSPMLITSNYSWHRSQWVYTVQGWNNVGMSIKFKLGVPALNNGTW